MKAVRALGLTCAALLGLSRCSGRDVPPPFVRLADPQVVELLERGPDFFESVPGVRLGPPSVAKESSREGNSRCVVDGRMRIPPHHVLRAVDVAVKCDDGRDRETVIHVYVEGERGPELAGFPARLTGSDRQRIWVGDQRLSGPWQWRAELAPCCSPNGKGSSEWAISLRPVISELMTQEVGYGAIRAAGETRPGLLLTPGTVASLPLPRGEGWHLETGAARLAGGNSIKIAVQKGDAQSEIASLSPLTRSWIEHDIPLPDLAPGSFLIVSAPEDVEGAGGCVALGDPVIRRSQDQRSSRPNVLLISLDTVRADDLRSWIDGVSDSEFNRLRSSFVVFSQVKANAPVTDASHLSLLTGQTAARLMPIEEGKTVMRGDMTPLAAVLGSNGYRCAAFTDGGLVGASYGFHRGFDRYWEYPGSIRDKTHLSKNLEQAWDWIAREDRTPWFTFVHTYQAHTPYVDHESPHSPAVNVGVVAKMSESTPVRAQVSIGDNRADDQEIIDTARRHYRSEISYLDRHLTPFLEALNDSGYLNNTLVVMFSDHGEGFGEHGLFGHNNTIYEEQLDVVLMMRFPGGQYGGTRIDGIVQLADVFPTLLDYAGIPSQSTVDGISLMPYIRSQKTPPQARPVISKQTWQSSVLLWPHKLIIGRTDFTTRLFDLERDPDERHDILETVNPEVVRRLKEPFLDVILGVSEGFALVVTRPRARSGPLDLIAPQMGGWALYFRVPSDSMHVERGRWSLDLGPSAGGDVVITVPSIRGIRVESGEQALPRLTIGDNADIGGYGIRVIRCGGEAPTEEIPARELEAPDHDERLKALGYIQ